MSRALRLLLAAVLALLAPRAARADAPALVSPPDVAVALQPQLDVPPLPPELSVAERGWLRVAYPRGVESRVQPLLDDADDFKAALANAMGVPVLDDRVELRVARTPEGMAALAPAALAPHAWAVGETYPALRLVVVSLVDPTSHEGTNVPEVARHELVHLALSDAVQGRHVPLWFHEGLAIHFSGENAMTRTSVLWQASLSKGLVPLADVDTSYPQDRYDVNVAYAESADFVRFLLREPDKQRFGGLIERVRGGAPFERAVADAYGTDLRRLEFEWREGLSRRFTIWPVLGGGSLVWLLGIGILGLGWLRKRRRAKATLERWEREDAAVAVVSARPEDDAVPRPSVPRVPLVEHEGAWHTLH